MLEIREVRVKTKVPSWQPIYSTIIKGERWKWQAVGGGKEGGGRDKES